MANPVKKPAAATLWQKSWYDRRDSWKLKDLRWNKRAGTVSETWEMLPAKKRPAGCQQHPERKHMVDMEGQEKMEGQENTEILDKAPRTWKSSRTRRATYSTKRTWMTSEALAC